MFGQAQMQRSALALLLDRNRRLQEVVDRMEVSAVTAVVRRACACSDLTLLPPFRCCRRTTWRSAQKCSASRGCALPQRRSSRATLTSTRS